MSAISDDNLLPVDRGVMHPLSAATPSLYRQLLRDHGGADRGCRFRAAAIHLLCMGNGLGRLRQRLMHDRRIRATRIEHPPVFIVGHWRSGTTFLHDLMHQDPAFAAPTLWHTLAPRAFIAERHMRWFYRLFLPDRRPMDNVVLRMDASNEDEMALACLGRWSYIHCLYFPRDADRQFRQGVLLEGLGADERQQFADNLRWFLQAVTYDSGGRPLIVKNPAHTARVPLLLELFPGAKFIHIHRNPFDVYPSTCHMRMRLTARLALQRTTAAEIERQVIDQYQLLMRAWFRDERLIPRDRLVDVRYEDLERDPLTELRRIYEKLSLPGVDAAEPHFRDYLTSLRDYKKNEHTLSAADCARVSEAWRFTIERWRYDSDAEKDPAPQALGLGS